LGLSGSKGSCGGWPKVAVAGYSCAGGGYDGVVGG
jgi:hypothetical protein